MQKITKGEVKAFKSLGLDKSPAWQYPWLHLQPVFPTSSWVLLPGMGQLATGPLAAEQCNHSI